MSVQVNVSEAKSKLCELMARAERGERVELCRKGKPVLALVPIEAAPKPMTPFQRAYGAWAHLGPLSDEANELLRAPDPDFADAKDQDWWP